MVEILLLSPSDTLTERTQEVVVKRGLNFTIHCQTIAIESIEMVCDKAARDGIKVIISRGGMAYLIRNISKIPCVEIKQTVSSYIEALMQVKDKKGLVAFFSLPDISEKTKALCSLSNIVAKCYKFYDDESAQIAVSQALKDGCVTGIGGALSGKYAMAQGLNYVVLENSYEEIDIAISSAMQLMHSIKDNNCRQRQLQLQMHRYEAILNYTHDGIIAIDKEGKVVIVNKQAEKILPLCHKPYEGKPIELVLKETKLLPVLRNGKPELDELMKIGDEIICTNRVPILMDNQIEGVVATFRDIESIRASELKIRTNLKKRGYTSKYRFADMIGSSKIFQQTVDIAKCYAKTDSNVLLIGEIGTGKEMLAHCIHHSSKRRKEPFITLNCANYTTTQLRMELLGYEKILTDSKHFSKMGVFELAHGGTLFLDKVCAASLEIQSMIVGILESNEVRRIGGDNVIPVDVRIIASVSNDPVKSVSNGTLLSELVYMLSVLTLRVPLLKERESDWRLLCEEFFHRSLGIEYRQYQGEIRKILDFLRGIEWTGNIRQLMNIVERCCVLLKNKMTVEDIVATFPPRILDEDVISEKVLLDKWNKDNIIKTLTIHHFNITRAALALECSRSTLYKKMKQFNIVIDTMNK